MGGRRLMMVLDGKHNTEVTGTVNAGDGVYHISEEVMLDTKHGNGAEILRCIEQLLAKLESSDDSDSESSEAGDHDGGRVRFAPGSRHQTDSSGGVRQRGLS